MKELTKIQIREFVEELDTLTKKKSMTPEDHARASAIRTKIGILRSDIGIEFPVRSNLTQPESGLRVSDELRAMGIGTGGAGGYLAPQEFQDAIVEAMAQTDPLLDEDTVTLIREKNPQMGTKSLVGWDLSAIESSRKVENAQETLSVQPAVISRGLGGFLHTCSLLGSMEFEQDSFFPVLGLMARAFGVGFARGIGADVVAGTGTGQPQGLLTGAADSTYTTAGAGALTAGDFDSIYFSVDRAYRASPKAAWVMNDSTYLLARKAADLNGRPLLSIHEDDEKILGRRVLVSPSMPSTAGSKGIVFGDLSNFVVRLGPIEVEPSDRFADYGKTLWNGRQRVDSFVYDPSGGSKPAIVFATLHA
jgi:HK97 family phage major capsid protein